MPSAVCTRLLDLYHTADDELANADKAELVFERFRQVSPIRAQTVLPSHLRFTNIGHEKCRPYILTSLVVT